ncbi:hypothetical protein FOZ63_025652 [Perkinsus olseni]|uniref:Major facilitator superfamily (MFS) profile domain-containing protein n=2 Tax=Perkinsus olseni TaxID=32597 RepID=A0A7J6RRK7_PEROL|nr:hypothetical protein FOZ63_025652 [Perkinsus olseni]
MGFGLAVSILTMSFIFGRCFGSAIMGPVSDRAGRWNTIMVCSLLTAFGFLLQALSWSFWSLVGFRFFTGFVGGTRVVIIVYITDWMTERYMLTFWMSFIPIVSSVSSFAGPFLGGIVAQADQSHPLNPAYAGFALNATSFLLVLLFMRKSPKDAGLRICTSKTSEGSSSAASTPSSAFGPLVEWKAVLLWFLVCGLSSAGTQGWSVLLVTIQKELGLSSLVLGSISGWCGLMIIAGQLLVLPILFHRLKFSEGAVVVFGFALSPSIIILGFVADLWATVAIGSLFSLGVPLIMTMGFAIFSRLCDPSRKSFIVGLLALDVNIFKVVSILLSGILYDINKWIPYVMLFCLVVVGMVAGFAIMRIMPKALRRRSRVKVILAATEASRSRINGNLEKRRFLKDRLGFGNEESQGDALALPSGSASKEEIDAILDWIKHCFFLPPKTFSESKGDIVPDLVKSLLGRWTTTMLEQHGYVNWYECDREIVMLLEAGFPQLRLEPQHARFMRLQDFYEATLRHLAACEAYAVVQASSVGENVPEYLIVATSKLSRPPRQASTLAMRGGGGGIEFRYTRRIASEKTFGVAQWLSHGSSMELEDS